MKTESHFVKWKCQLCNDEIVSDRREHHKMNYCKCKKSAVDAEEHYVRALGEVEFEEK
jgi:hypothetical protein